VQRRLHLLTNGRHEGLPCLGIEVLHQGNCGRVDIYLPGEELLGFGKRAVIETGSISTC
jgi:hypothetical protein